MVRSNIIGCFYTQLVMKTALNPYHKKMDNDIKTASHETSPLHLIIVRINVSGYDKHQFNTAIMLNKQFQEIRMKREEIIKPILKINLEQILNAVYT